MSKYIIEIEGEPFVKLSALFGEEGLYRAKGFKSLVFDQFGLDKLTPLDKALDEAYLQGKHDAEQDLARAAYKEAYHKGYDEAKLIYQNPNAESDYQRGLDDAWEAARNIAQQWEEDTTEYRVVIDDSIRITLDSMTASEAIAKLRECEQQKPDLIKVGDEVKDRTDDCGVVKWIYGNDSYVLWQDGSTGNYAADELIKTGRHFNFLASLLNAMKEGAE